MVNFVQEILQSEILLIFGIQEIEPQQQPIFQQHQYYLAQNTVSLLNSETNLSI